MIQITRDGLPGYVASTGEVINIADAYQDSRFNRNIDKISGYRTKSVLCVPVKYEGSIMAVALVVNKKGLPQFSYADQVMFQAFAAYAGASLRNARWFRLATQAQEKSTAMLKIAHSLATEQLDGDRLVAHIMDRAREITKADRCSLFVVDTEKKILEAHFSATTKVQMPLNAGIAGHVATTGQVVNIPDAYEDPRFNRDIDKVTGYRTNSILCMPVIYEGNVVAVAQLVNKLEGPRFTHEDEDVFTTFSTYAAVTLRNAKMYALAKREQQKSEIMLTMAHTLSSAELDADNLPFIIMSHARRLTNADQSALFLVNPNKKYLEAQIGNGLRLQVPVGSGVAGYVASTGETLNIPDAYADDRFDAEVDRKSGYKTKSLLCMPVKYENNIVAVAQLMNKISPDSNLPQPFTKDDEDMFVTFSSYAALALRNCHEHVALVHAKRKIDVLVGVLAKLSRTNIRRLDEIIENIMLGAQELLAADRCAVFIVDRERHELYSKVALKTGGKIIRFRMDQGIAGEVARTSKTLNITDAYADSRFNKDIDKQMGFVTKSVLTSPIIHEGNVVAVIQMLNKQSDDQVFTSEDEELLEYFSMFAGITLANAKLMEFVLGASWEAMKLMSTTQDPPQAVTREYALNIPSPQSQSRRPRSPSQVLSTALDPKRCFYLRHLELTEEECRLVKTVDFNLHIYKDGVDHMQERCIPLLLHLFQDIGCVKYLEVDLDILCRFLMRACSLYRSVPYHNWYHAVDVTQTMYLLLKSIDPLDMLSPLEKYVLMVASVVHDVDHMGLNNSFHFKAETPMGILSNSAGSMSVLEVHHCNLAIEILSDQSTNAFHSLSRNDRIFAYKTMVNCILGTDMAKHNQILNLFATFPHWEQDEDREGHKNVVLQMLLKSADISNVLKPFEVARLWALAVTEEFYTQGDLEKRRGLEVLPMYDREKANLAQGQVGFIDFLAMKQFQTMANWSPYLQWTIDACMSNRQRWKDLVVS
eukprot:NODE_220_length_3207_cov_54.419909_g191_i0.p1 GENE.NODE_220_length_3207_cov_54.419909_g191_i0~~NODE_220_length_3207_cov_54.419909_g191_i0.p1  ORF type:complete len:1025 (-),score=180.24 NODE_220_length_3207_cov_54.419909_g191_i0:133-3090(-)